MQSANASNNGSDRTALQAEVTQLRQEIDRVAKTTSFNGTKLLDGTFANATFQVGANAGEGIAIDSIVSASSATLGQLGDTDLFVSNVTHGADGAMAALDAGDLVISGVELGPIAAATTGAQRSQQVVDAVNARSSDTGIFARMTDTGYQLFSATDFDDGAFTGGWADDVTGAAVPADAAPLAAADRATLGNINVNSFGDAQLSLQVIDAAINSINSSRADLGALQSRFENAVANIQITGENVAAARGRIVDADFAKETSNLSRAQILQQAGTAMVAQANQAQQGVLSLLR